jgi:hypothetical protein
MLWTPGGLAAALPEKVLQAGRIHFLRRGADCIDSRGRVGYASLVCARADGLAFSPWAQAEESV